MGLDIKTLAAAKKNIKESLEGAGVLKGDKGEPGKDGITPHIGDNNNWFIGTQDTGVKAKGENGEDGVSPRIGNNGNWYIGDYDTNVKASGSDGDDGFTPTISEYPDNTDYEYRLKITNKDGGIVTPNLKGAQGLQGIPGEQGKPGNDGQRGLQGIQGEKGNDGYPFLIYKEYPSLDDFNSADFPEIGLMFMIKPDGATDFPVYRYTGEGDTPYSYITSLAHGEAIKGDKGDPGTPGEQGIPGKDGKDGTTYSPSVGSVITLSSGTPASASVCLDDEKKEAVFNFSIPEGAKGESGTDGKDGRSIKAIARDENNNIIVTFDDNSTENIGELSVDVQADFLTEEGFGKLRYYNGHFQYYDTAAWVDTSVTPDNVYIVNVMPKPMQSVRLFYDKKINRYKIRWKEPTDTVVDGQAMCIIEKIVIRRKLNASITNENDGDLVTTINRRDFEKYEDTWFVDDLEPNEGDIWYYKWFPVTTVGLIENSSANERYLEAKQYQLYGFILNQNESDPGSMITYIEDNEEFNPVHMDYTNDTFDYGDWTESAFFMNVKPCMLKYDGTVDYYLNKDDYALKENGEPSDVANSEYAGNAMIQFPKIYWKIQNNGDNTANIYISNFKVDEGFQCWSHIDKNGDEIDYCYMPVYDGTVIGDKLRSLSGYLPSLGMYIEKALANNQVEDITWFMEVWADRILVNLLLLLIGKSADTQNVFGMGMNYQSSMQKTGLMDNKGLFYGGDSNVGVKIFGMEHWWGNPGRIIMGYVLYNYIPYVKLTYGKSDGSTVEGYNYDGSGYIKIDDARCSGSYWYIGQMQFSPLGMYPISKGSATTYYCDTFYYNNTGQPCRVGCPALNGSAPNGAFAVSTYAGKEVSSLSCKPLAHAQGGTQNA